MGNFNDVIPAGGWPFEVVKIAPKRVFKDLRILKILRFWVGVWVLVGPPWPEKGAAQRFFFVFEHV